MQHPAAKKDAIDSYAAYHIYNLAMLCATPAEILYALMFGSLEHLRMTNDYVRELLDELLKRGAKQLCQYMLEFVDPMGISPTPRQLFLMIQYARKYADFSDPILAVLIDSQFSTLTSDERRTRRRGEWRSYLQNPDAFLRLEEFLAAMEQRLYQIPQDQWDTPLKIPLREIGYANNGLRRLTEHFRHNGSNYLMNLFEAISCAYFDGKFRMKGNVIFLCFCKVHAPFGEILFSILARSYHKTGFGFNHELAGTHVHSAWKVDDWRWEKWLKWARKNSPMSNNIIEEYNKVRKYETAYDALQEKVRQTEAEEREQQIVILQLKIKLAERDLEFDDWALENC